MKHHITIPTADIELQYSRASGPGGQNVNKVETRVQLFFNIDCPQLADDTRERLKKIASNQINKQGQLVINSQRFRSQERNRHAALKQLHALIEHAQQKPKLRKKTTLKNSVKEKRSQDKKRKSSIKQMRQRPRDE